ncbi:3-dehydroquinate synthase [uncultured Aquimonas sp.]|uniref:3-dehydroquinate synthase n=1 Tax=uncultured Aquimonas sp. TaxID=385483 RepID=UPI000A586FDD|nr:3-dehydroquinate synthase [uncultured Aquimonas sp.]
MRSLDVQLAERSYPIHIGPGLLQNSSLWRPLLPGRQVLVVCDDPVAGHYLQRVRAGLDGLDHASLVLPPGEQEKTLARFGEAIDALAGLRANRDACVIALGGGVVGDLAGFAAACWMRGIAFIQMPTTLLAMVDSSVGGKTAVDLPQGKNLVGAFHQPRAVIADTDTLATLPDRELRAGLAEVVKYGAIFDAGFLDWLDDHADALLARDADTLAEAILRSCRYKADVVARDETEQGERALLNFGHTFGHALETAGGYERFRHGEAVALGMVIAARLSAQLGRAPAADARRLSDLLARLGLPVEIPPGFDPAYLLQLMRLDKKALSGRLRLILWKQAGAAEIVAGVDEDAVLAALAA